MKVNSFILALLGLFFCFCVIESAAQDKKSIILTVDNDAITLEEFENIFKKNNSDSIITKEALDDYMELFINFKLKVKEAKEMGMDTISKFRNELLGYRAQLARPYLTDTEVQDALVKEAYEHMKYEVKAAHILVKCDPTASPQDTLAAYNKIMELRNRVIKGEDFATIAKEKSDDPSAKENGGELGYFTAFQMVYPFENGAYNTPVGSVSMPVRSRYGYHLIKVEDKRPARGEIHVEHIMVKEKEEENGSFNARAKIQEIAGKVKAGESFEDLAAKYSDDGSSAKKGGELPWFGTNKMVPEFESAAFALTKDGEVSDPFKTQFGWHIVKRIGYKPLDSFDKLEKEIKNKVSKDVRAEQTRQSFINKLKKTYNYHFYDASATKLAAKADTSVFNGKLKAKKKVLKAPLFEINGHKYSNSDFVNFLKKKSGLQTNMTPHQFVLSEANQFAQEELLKLEDSKLEEKYDAFRLLVNEYREGILLFELTDQKVWSKAVKDTVGMEKYYEDNKQLFTWPDRADVIIYTCADEKIAKQLRELLKAGVDKSDIAGQLNDGTQLNLQIERGLYSGDDKEVLTMTSWAKGLSQNIPYNNQIVVIDFIDIIPSSVKRLSEARGLITSDYQTWLEEKWIQDLRSKHTFKVNKEILYSIH
ncbi:MAG: peptidylprolyl isomerase [Crocinitomicaceae bacterium]|nr:peptidylprolyl isomerase [Crocinitomicaceae bacterium]